MQSLQFGKFEVKVTVQNSHIRLEEWPDSNVLRCTQVLHPGWNRPVEQHRAAVAGWEAVW